MADSEVRVSQCLLAVLLIKIKMVECTKRKGESDLFKQFLKEVIRVLFKLDLARWWLTCKMSYSWFVFVNDKDYRLMLVCKYARTFKYEC